MQISMGFILLSKLKNRFDDFYAEYGCYLWTVFIIQALSLLILVITQALLILDDSIYDFFIVETNDVTFCICSIIYHIVAHITTMLTQLSCLMFGWIRYRKDAKKRKTQQLTEE